MSTQAGQTTTENQPATITMTRAIYKMDGGLDYIYRVLGYVCGTLLLLLGLFITYQVIARKLGGPMAPGMDQLSGYVARVRRNVGLLLFPSHRLPRSH